MHACTVCKCIASDWRGLITPRLILGCTCILMNGVHDTMYALVHVTSACAIAVSCVCGLYI